MRAVATHQKAEKAGRRATARPPLALSLQWVDAQHRVNLPRHTVVRCIRAALAVPAEMTVRIVGRQEARELNAQWRQKDYATNVLTFDYAHEPVVQADLVLCAEVVAREAVAEGKDLVAHYAHLLVHGTLHAQGWDHENPEEAQAMEDQERAILARLGWPDPYAGERG